VRAQVFPLAPSAQFVGGVGFVDVNVTLWMIVPSFHVHVTWPPAAIRTLSGLNAMFWSETPAVVGAVIAVVVKVTDGAPAMLLAVAVAVCAPSVPLNVRVALAVPFAPVVFCAGVIEPPPPVAAQSIVTPCFGLSWPSRAVTV